MENYIHDHGNDISKDIMYNRKYQQIMRINHYYLTDKETLKQKYLHIQASNLLNCCKNSKKQ